MDSETIVATGPDRTFATVLLPGAVVGRLFGWAEYPRRSSGAEVAGPGTGRQLCAPPAL